MNQTVLITGASGLIGKPLTRFLLDKGYKVHQLTRDLTKPNDGAKAFKWNVANMEIDEKCIENVDAIINLAGEGIADKTWTQNRKQQIIESRTGALKLLYKLLKETNHQVKTFISSSAVGHYGDRKDEILTEQSEPGTDFMANTCLAWERSADKISSLGIRLVKFRTGVVLSNDGGSLPKMAKPIRLNLVSVLGSGKQWVSWIHIDDALNMILYALENQNIQDIYNMCSPFPVTNKELTNAIAKQLHKPLWMPAVPELALRIILGEMSRVVLNSQRVSADKIVEAGFKFKYPKIEQALRDIYE